MVFRFSYLCDLLSSLEENRIVRASTAAKNANPDTRVIARWFAQHEKRIHHATTNPLALLSSLFPEKRIDRVYWLQDTSLARVIGRCLLLGSSRREELDRWRVSGGVDLGQCVENVMRQAENHILDGQEVSVEEIDTALDRIASRCKFSGSRVRRQHTAVDVEEALAPLYRRLSSRDAKWLTRMILKSYIPVVVPVIFVLRSYHFLLPHLLLFQDSFDAALHMLRSEPIRHFPPRPESGLAKGLSAIALQHLTPVIGVKIGRPEYCKARSIKHCCQMAAQRRMSLERKYDGEYCQIHIDLSSHSNSIQIFSKSGKDSTADRAGIHRVIKEALRIGKNDCRFSRRCILEGELLVWSDKHGKIVDFHKLRKFISRSGTFIGTENDSPPQPYEHLMIVFFDILLIDDNVCLRKPHRERRLLLKSMIRVIPGRAGIAEQEILDFSHADSQYRLERSFSKCITQRWEGYVLKGCDEPYFSMSTGDGTPGCWIKLKKDYIPGLGDTVDLAIIGGRYDSRDAAAMKDIRRLSWTHFMIGCLVNKDAVLRLRAKPKYRVVDTVNRHSMSRQNMRILNQFGEFSACSHESGHGVDIEQNQCNVPYAGTIFKTPFVVEMMGSGFEKPSGARYFTLRFPRVVKIHWDRKLEEAASFSELQLLAEAARSMSDDLSQEQNQWRKRLRLGDGASHYIVDRSQSTASTTDSSYEDLSETISPIRCSSSPGGIASDYSKRGEQRLQSKSIGLIGHAQVRHGVTKAPINSIPIYVDQAESRSTSEEPCLGPKSLTENDNLSQGRVPRAVDLHPKHQDTTPIEASHNASCVNRTDMMDTSVPSTATNRMESTQNVRSNCASKGQQKCPRSPLTAIPVYLTPTLLSEYQTTKPLNLARTLQTTTNVHAFLNRLTSQVHKNILESTNHAAIPHHTSIGLVCIDGDETPLGPELLRIGRAIDTALKNASSDFPAPGKIFFLDSSFLGLETSVADQRFCLRTTWENIAKSYFYACLAWGSGVEIVFDKDVLSLLGDVRAVGYDDCL